MRTENITLEWSKDILIVMGVFIVGFLKEFIFLIGGINILNQLGEISLQLMPIFQLATVILLFLIAVNRYRKSRRKEK